mmetsp:Transcript_59947/g.126914  ORF Transcript_59947/g.126914 Transcript_59947/m.126914 type:complete len:242 (-) Transcript_59947:94-819(-)|eukprot:CAMPEP_0206481340 /NCGR_PEP_ID=MMETSP0324_2-20121206/38080_1 /ASSEMBLY_ACC=CAM_ASM_000836 /TAXON_ID=2866 /ORGANISM="Crypthecodinium cohnii, Strain Seligo" /LENGTH=241 /DNA_ID=CAMNT_0053958797 /DNA_START=54 /DNA_END=779 /DNA_ORIENTATION=-
MAADDQAEGLVDKLRGGDFDDMIKQANQATQAQMEQQLCLRSDGNIVKGDPYTAFAGVAQALENRKPVDDEDPQAELKRLRAQRLAQMQDEAVWRQQGHGSLRELKNEREFVECIQPHARAVVLLDDSRGPAEDVKRALDKLAKSHMEAQFCRLPVEKALFLTHMVELEGLPAIFVLHEGSVTRHLPPSRLFEFASGSSPLFPGHLAKLLHRVDAITSPDGASSGGESEDEEERRPTWKRA